MKGFLEWFKSGTKMKRWILLLLVGIILAGYGMATILVSKELAFADVAKIILIFVLGFTCVILALVFMQKRTLELLVEASDSRLQNKKDVNSLIFNKKVYNEGPKVVVIGGGTGLNTVLKGLKHYTNNITAIVTVSNYGKNRTNSQKQLNSLPIEDIKESIVALSHNEAAMEGLFSTTFTEGVLRDLSFGDIYFSSMNKLYGDFTESVKESKDILNMVGKVLPVTLDEMTICAELEDGTIVEEKDKIPQMVYEKVSKIARIFVRPTNCRPAPGVLEAIAEADAIVIGPGSLYTNVIPNLLIKNVAKTIRESKAIKIYVSNIMTEPGQTDNYGVSDHLQAIIDHAGKGIVDYCIYDTGEIIPEFIKRYNRQGADLVEQDIAKAKGKGVNLLQRNLSFVEGEYIRHNPDAIAASIIELICDDLKFEDRQNAPEFLKLNSMLKEKKRKIKKEKTVLPKEHKKQGNRKKSKFQAKYEERIQSIRHSEKAKPAKVKEAEDTKKETAKRNKKQKHSKKHEKATK